MDEVSFPSDGAVPVDAAMWFQISQFLYEEATLLDQRRFDEWLELVAEDVRYWMPIRFNRQHRDARPDIARRGEAAFFDETKHNLQQRVRRLKTGRAWAEEPASRARRLVTNIRAWMRRDTKHFEVAASFLVWRTRRETNEALFIGGRFDLLRRTERHTGFEIAQRTLILDQAVLKAENLSVIF